MFISNSEDRTFAVIPADPETLRYAHKHLGKNELILWICLASHANHRFGGAAWPSPKRLRQLTGISKSQIHLSLTLLIETGFIEPTGGKVGKARVFKVLTGKTQPKTNRVAPTTEIKNEAAKPVVGQDIATQSPPMVPKIATISPSMVPKIATPNGTDERGNQQEPSFCSSSSSVSLENLKIPSDMTDKIASMPIASIVSDFSEEAAQQVLDELVGQMRIKELSSPIGYAFRLAQLHRAGKMVPSVGLAIKNERITAIRMAQEYAAEKKAETAAIADSDAKSTMIANAMKKLGQERLGAMQEQFYDKTMLEGGFKSELIRKSGGRDSTMFKTLFRSHFEQNHMAGAN